MLLSLSGTLFVGTCNAHWLGDPDGVTLRELGLGAANPNTCDAVRCAAPWRRELVAADSRGNVAAFTPNATELWERHVGSNVAQARPALAPWARWLQY